MQNLTRHDASARQFLLILYAINGLYFLSFMISPIIAVILAYTKRQEWGDSIYRDHLQYVITTFWRSFWGMVIGAPLTILGVGFVLWSLVGIWFGYRCIFGAWRIWSYQTVKPEAWLELP